MNKTKVLIITKNLIAGGIETSMLSFIENMKSIVDIDLMVFNKSGILMDRLPSDIQVFEGGRILRSLNRACQGGNNNNQQSKKIDIKRLIVKCVKALGGRKILSQFAFVGQKIKNEYDIVLCYNGLDQISADFALKCVKAKQKMIYVHSDVSRYDIKRKMLTNYEQFNKILCVSRSCAEIFKNKYPNLADKVDYLYNFQDIDRIKNGAEEFTVEYGKDVNIVSVSRLSEEKAHLRSLQVFNKLHNEGYRFHWHIVGDGDTRPLIEKYIQDNKMEEYITLHGNQKNPYPYIKSSDIFYLGSYHEAAPMVYSEAMTLGVPVITTRTSSSEELVGDLGFICDNSEEDIYAAFKEILTNTDKITAKKNSLENYSYDNDKIKERFNDMTQKMKVGE